MKLLHICEVCGKKAVLTPEEAYNAGWDYPPLMGHFGIVSPRKCPDCRIGDTVWAAITLHKKDPETLTEEQIQTIMRILGEPESILVEEE